MKYCPHCHVEVNSERKLCPLCFHVLEDTEGTKNYQEYPKYHGLPRAQTIAMRILLYLVIVAIIACTIVNIATLNNASVVPWWCVIVDACLIYFYCFIAYMIKTQQSMAVRFLIHLIILSVVLIAIDLITRPHDVKTLWSLGYVIPFSISATILTLIIMIFIKNSLYRDYLPTTVFISLISFIPLILYFTTSWLSILWPSIVAASVGLLVLLGIFIFPQRVTQEEIQKRFHL